MSVFYRDIDVNISDYKSELSKPLVVFERDRGLEIYFNLIRYAYRFDKNPSNLLENLVGAYATVTLVNPSGYEISIDEVEITEDAKVKFVITEDLTDELTEIGTYQLQIHVNNDVEGRDTSVFSIPPFEFEVRERLKGKKNELLDSEGNGLTDKEGYQLVSASTNKVINFSADKINEYLSSIPTIQDEIKDINSQLDTKAKQVDLEVEKARIDNLAKLTDGSTTGDAELIDARIGENGKTYPNIGDSLRSQIGDINKFIEKEKINFISGSYIDKNGDINSLSTFSRSDFIKVYPGDKIFIKATGFSSNVSIVYSFNLDKTKDKPLIIGDSSLREYNVLIEKEMYVICSGESINLEGYIIRDNGSIILLDEKINNVKNILNSNERFLNFNMINGGYINYQNGEITELAGYSYTEFIDVSELKGIKIKVTSYFDFLSGLAQYDNSKTYINGVGLGTNTIGDIQEIEIVGDFIRCTCKNANINDFKMTFLYSDFLYNTEKVDNPPTEYKSSFMSMFSKGICIGDSFTEGACNINASNEQFITDRFNYPKILSKLSGVDIVNKGVSGITSKLWYINNQGLDLSGYDFAIIYLGINDYFNNNKLLYDTYYSQIIDKLKAENKNIKIFCVTITKHFDFSSVNKGIRQVCNDKSCFLIDLEKYSKFNSSHITGSHPNAIGYTVLANEIYNYIGYIIENNINSFKNHQFTNTDYTY